MPLGGEEVTLHKGSKRGEAMKGTMTVMTQPRAGGSIDRDVACTVYGYGPISIGIQAPIVPMLLLWRSQISSLGVLR